MDPRVRDPDAKDTQPRNWPDETSGAIEQEVSLFAVALLLEDQCYIDGGHMVPGRRLAHLSEQLRYPTSYRASLRGKRLSVSRRRAGSQEQSVARLHLEELACLTASAVSIRYAVQGQLGLTPASSGERLRACIVVSLAFASSPDRVQVGEVDN
jgi:hypothetical protein